MADLGQLSLSEVQDAIHQLDKNEQSARPLLQDPTRQIRLFTLWPGTQESPIQGVFSVAILDDGPDYQCISYVWGDATVTKDITVDGKEFKITTSLFSVLRRIRSEQKNLTVWANALCINQDDHEEKRVQVDMMFDIYSKCRNCFLWLGEVDLLDGELDLDIARYCLNFIEFCDDADLEKDDDGFSTAEGLMKIRLTFRSLVSCQWWRRIWTVQECVAPHTAIFLWGPLTISRSPLIHFCENSMRMAFETRRWISDKLDEHYFEAAGALVSLLQVLSALRHRIESKSQAVLDGVASISFLWNACDRRALDPRDKIFALLPFIAGALARVKSSNYDIDCVELYSRVTVDLIRSCQSLLPLMGRRQSEMPLEEPSWVLDWHRQEMAQHGELNAFGTALQLTHHFDASHGLPQLDFQNLVSGNGRHLRLRGYFVDTLVYSIVPPAELSSIPDRPFNYVQHLITLREIWKHCVARDTFSVLRKLDRPLVTNEAIAEFSGMWDDVLNLDKLSESQDWHMKENARLQYWLYTRIMAIFIASAGRFGVGTWDVKLGDEVWKAVQATCRLYYDRSGMTAATLAVQIRSFYQGGMIDTTW
ncbi:heterokaryon incompatibility protein [Colletotrichum fioriniae PJ7]|uniref:Heterokaryon incompatibility protein n=1 Tax=Colletotrichum fioriniae PJ7 TaxID=1445577 RepID=A0A010QIQ7_9PEZI|nr:heterokaryon incompatibility protein [Colletotrichum fioriniae PJ7]